MNETNDTPQPPELPTTESNEAMRYEAMTEKPSLGHTVDALLKAPGRLLFEWQEGESRTVSINLVIIATASFLVFGLILGFFAGGEQLWSAPVKVSLGITLSALITLPSLYVFSCLGGLDMTLRKSAGVLLIGLALVGLVLLGLCPVAWIFSQSTDSLGFMGFLVLLFWVVALCFGITLIFRSARCFGSKRSGYLVLWAGIFVVVTLQMSTSLRPIIGPAEETWLPTEKQFFLQHWFGVLSGED